MNLNFRIRVVDLFSNGGGLELTCALGGSLSEDLVELRVGGKVDKILPRELLHCRYQFSTSNQEMKPNEMDLS